MELHLFDTGTPRRFVFVGVAASNDGLEIFQRLAGNRFTASNGHHRAAQNQQHTATHRAVA
jgi:hypothetical protein